MFVNVIVTAATAANINKKSPANAKQNAQQWCMLESPDDQWLIIYGVLLVLTRRRDLSRSANAVSARNRKFFLPPLT